MAKISGEEKFQKFFSEIYQDRWIELLKSMRIREKQVLRSCFKRTALEKELSWLPNCSWYEENLAELAHSKNLEGLRNFYIMNPASIIAARALEVCDNDKVLDMCAAPGGKSLILMENISSDGELWANEISSNRRQKLTRVIREYVPSNLRDNIFVKGKDGLKYGLQHPDTFDKILIDAPCSGERHLVETPKELEKWSEKRTKRLAGTQYGLLCSGLLALKSGGQMVYSTCSISPLENDLVIEKLLEKKSDSVVLDLPEPATPWAEKTKYGYLHLPDKCGFGPIFYTRLRKL